MVHFELFERTMSMSLTAAGASCEEPVWLNLSRYRYPWWPAKVSTFHLLHTLLHLLYHPFAPPCTSFNTTFLHDCRLVEWGEKSAMFPLEMKSG